jgi:hypothetical protein
MKSKSTVDTRLERDPRYVPAKALLNELKGQLTTAEKERNDLQTGISSLADRASRALAAEAQTLLSGCQAPEPAVNQRQHLTDSLGKVDHQIAVLRQAITMQQQTVEGLTAKVSQAICADMLPMHCDNVRKVAQAYLVLEECCRAEQELRDELNQNGVLTSGTLRPMSVRGCNSRDSNSALSRYLLEAVEFKFLAASEIPESLRAYVRRPAKPQPEEPAHAPGDGWLHT